MTDEQTTSNPAAGPIVTPADIQRQEFGVSRFGGYRMRDVDEFLDRLTESTEALVAENDRLRSAGGPIVGTSDLDDVNRQADEILRRAREEASRIVADAGASAVAADGGNRAAVDPFLAQERAFLQSLATLVQGHAESVKAMAKRTRSEQAEPAAADRAPATPPKTEAKQSETKSETSKTGASKPAPTPPAPPTVVPDEGPGDTVVLEDPQPSQARGEARGKSDDSLRQLFWGEDR